MQKSRHVSVALCVVALAVTSSPSVGADVDFDRDVRPILSDYCFKCHGPDGAARQADLRLDSRESIVAKREGSAIVVPGDASASEVIRRVASQDPDERMPPESTGLRLNSEQVDVLRRWIDEGARWDVHWAFAPVAPVDLPPDDSGWSRNPLDRLVLARLREEGLPPSPEADRGTRLRRVTFDLTGLPPTPAELDDFLADGSDDAYERVVDRLLQSPRYGERLAVRWLDAARYADTNGYQTDGPREMWRWRDWVIDAYNRNMPFDQFTIEQLAGDLLPDATVEQIVATGFNRNHRANSEGGVVPEEYLVEYAVDRVDTTATVWLGLTAKCARCHDHKYDPITQKEFYRLYAYFNNIPERGKVFKYGNTVPVIAYPTDEQRETTQRIERKLENARRRVDELEGALDEAQRRWEVATRGVGGDPGGSDFTITRGLVVHHALDGDTTGMVGGTRGEFREGDAAYVSGVLGSAADFDGKRYVDVGDVAKFSFFDKFSLGAWVYSRGRGGGIASRMEDHLYRKGYCLEVIDGKVHASLVARWLDDALRVHTKRSLSSGSWHHVVMTYDGTRYPEGVRIYVDGVSQELVVDYGNMVQSMEVDVPFRIGNRGTKFPWDGWIDDVRVYEICLEPEEVAILATPSSIDEIVAMAPEKRSSAQAGKLRSYFLEHHASSDFRETHRRLAQLRRQRDSMVERYPTVMVMRELKTPRRAHVLVRGEYDNPGKPVSRGVPEFLPPLAAQASDDRLGLAKWIADPANPLTARVAVNRLWQMFFGAGLVKSTEDFGARGDRPSHSRLLDWLAAEFVRDWDVKRLVRAIVTSATYQQSSRVTAELLQRDPENRLFARGARYRLAAEMIRDQALAASGLLVDHIGGRSVRPYQPADLWRDVVEKDQAYEQGHGESLYRRSMYTFWKRIVAPPGMITFDAATREVCQVRESRTNTPLQALNLLNDVTYVEAARVFAQRTMLEGGKTDAARVRFAFRLATARWPSESEESILLRALERHRRAYGVEPDAVGALLAVGESDPPDDIDPLELASFTAVANLVLNLDEVITKE